MRLEAAGRFDADAEIDLVLRDDERLSFEFGRSADIAGAYRALGEHVLR